MPLHEQVLHAFLRPAIKAHLLLHTLWATAVGKGFTGGWLTLSIRVCMYVHMHVKSDMCVPL